MTTGVATRPHSLHGIATYRVSVLGPFQLFRDDALMETDRWQRPSLSLLKLLATAPGKRRLRDDLVDLLWPDSSPSAGASNLRYTVHRLRRDLGGGETSPLLSGGGWIALSPSYGWEVDLDRFEELATSEDTGTLEGAADLYRGEPLAENRYDDWAAPLREDIARTWRDVCRRLASFHWEHDSHQRGISWLERVLASDPLDEETLQQLLRNLSALGRRTEALRRYRQFEEQLEREMAVAPMPETLALVDEVQPGAGAIRGWMAPLTMVSRGEFVQALPTYPRPAVGRLVGRQREIGTILERLDATDRMVASLVLIAAEAGMGKTRLLAEIDQRARKDGVWTLAGGCYEQEGRLPYGPIHDALLDFLRAQRSGVLETQLGDLLPRLAWIIPELGPAAAETDMGAGDPGSRRLQLFSAVAQVLERIAAGRPMLLLLDDLQWTDEASLQLLHFLLRQPQLTRLLMVGTYREEEVGEDTTLAGLSDEHGSCLRLEPLTRSELALLLEERLGAGCAPALVERIHERSGGNPFFALQMLQLLQEEGRLEPSSHGWQLVGTEIEVPPAVRETVARRFRYLGPDEREALTLGAVLGREFDYAPLEAMWQDNERALFAALDRAEEMRLVAETGTGYAFRHPVLWEVVYHRAPPPRRALLHERAALTLEHFYGERAEDHAPELAHHFVAAGRVHLDRALHYLMLAGDQAERAFAHGEAEQHYRLALDLARQLGDRAQAAAALEKLGVVLRLTLRYAEAVEMLYRAARMSHEGGDLEGELQAMVELGRACYFGSMVEEGIVRLKPVIDRVGTDQPSAGLIALHISLSLLLRESHGGYQEAFEAADRAVKLADALGDSRARAPALVQRAAMLRVLGRHDEARRALEVAIPLEEQLGDLETLQRAVHSLAIACRLTGEFDQAAVQFEHALDLARRLGDPARVAYALAWLGEIRFVSGAWKEARALLEQGLELTRSFGSPLVPSCLARGLGELCAAEGMWEEATHYLEECMRAAGGGPDDALLEDMIEAQCLLAEFDLLEGRRQAALNRLEQTAKLFGPYHQRFTPWVLAWAYLETGDAERADVLMQQRIARAHLENSPFRVVDALRTRGMALARLARMKEADAMFCQAVSVARSMPYPYAEARALYEWGCAITESGQPKQAGERLEEALGIFRELGAQPYIERTEQALRSPTLSR